MSQYDTEHTGRSVTQRIGGHVRATISYALFLVGVALLASFFAPFVGLPELAFHSSFLPTIAAPTEQQSRFIDVAPLIVGVVASSLAVWLR